MAGHHQNPIERENRIRETLYKRGELTSKQLHQRLGLAQSTVDTAILRMIDRGEVERETKTMEFERYPQLVNRLTTKGKKLYERSQQKKC